MVFSKFDICQGDEEIVGGIDIACIQSGIIIGYNDGQYYNYRLKL